MKSFTIYEEYYELITLLSEKEQQELLLAITKYMFDGVEPKLNEKQNKIFKNLKRPLDKSKNRSKCGSKLKSNQNQNEIKIETNKKQNEIKLKSNQNQNENTSNDVNVNVNNYDSNYVVNVDVNVNNKDNNEKFLKFWEVYPRKDTKKKSEEWFKKHKVSDELLNTMLDKIEQFKKTEQWKNPKFIPQPYTWLNQNRWEDEILEGEDEQHYTKW